MDIALPDLLSLWNTMEYLTPDLLFLLGGMLWTTCDASDSGRTRLEGTLHNTLLRACAVKELFSACRDD
jgi:hypothetical protein